MPLPTLEELEELLPLQLDECPELVQAAFAGDEAKVQEISVESFDGLCT